MSYTMSGRRAGEMSGGKYVRILYGQSARRSKTRDRLPLLSTGSRLPSLFPAANRHRSLVSTKLYCLATEAHAREKLFESFHDIETAGTFRWRLQARRGEAVALTITPPRCTSPFTALCSSDYACVTNNIDNNHPSALCNTTTYLTYVIVPLDTL